MAQLPLSIVIPARNEGFLLSATVRAVKRTTRVRHEIIVVDDGSTPPIDGREVPGARVIRTNVRSAGAARNVGAAKAEGRVLVFLDAHCLPDFETLDCLVEHATDGRAAAVPGIVSAAEPTSTGWGLTLVSSRFDVEWLPRPATPFAEVPVMGGACVAIAATTFRALGGFAPFPPNTLEDTELSLRAWRCGVSVGACRDASVVHRFRDVHWTAAQRAAFANAAVATAVRHLDRRALQESLRSLEGAGIDDRELARLEADRDIAGNDPWFRGFCARFAICW